MPEFNFRVKIIGGKKTETKVFVESAAVNRKRFEFKSGAFFSDADFEVSLYKFISDEINRGSRKDLIEMVK